MTSNRGAQAQGGSRWRSPLVAGAALLIVGAGSFLAVTQSLGGNRSPQANDPHTIVQPPEATSLEQPLVAAALPELNFGEETMAAPVSHEIDAQRDPLAEHLYLGSLAVGLRSGSGRGRLESPKRPELVEALVEVQRGDTLMALLKRAGADTREAHQAIQALSSEYDPRHLRPGQEIQLALRGDDAGALAVEWLRLVPDPEVEVHVQREAEGYAALTVERPLESQDRFAQGEITSSLFAAGSAAQVPHAVIVEAIRAMSFDVDFQRDIQPGTTYEFLYESLADESGEIVKAGALHYVALGLGERERAFYRFETEDGLVDFYDANGLSARRGLLRTPIDGARVSSNYGMRRHPIKGYNRMHKGIDFAAPSGTPIYAAGDGVVEIAGRNGGYGNYVRIRHGNGYQTAYAHLSRFGKGVSSGARVRQGDVIGYVGSTGASTGPHLHYEVLLQNKQVNPSSIKLPTGRQLAGAEMEAFEKWVQEIDRKRAAQRQVQLASVMQNGGQTCTPKAQDATTC